MDVTKLLRELLVAADVEIVITLLPEVVARCCDKTTCDALFKRLERFGKGRASGFAKQDMHVLGHDHVSVDIQVIAATDAFKSLFEGTLGCIRDEEWLTVVTGKGYEVGLSGVMIPFKRPWH